MAESLKKILIVEDEKLIIKPLELKLKLSGFETGVAYNGEEALEILKNEKFDLVLLDLMMPRVDGFAVLIELKKRGDETPVIVASNLNQMDDISRALELGVNSYYVKSNTSLSEIVENIRKALNV
ncbi:MAG: response regulator [Patescibacteria group bacterium]|jgi:DNA-binding response OmpR family regulator